MIRVVVCLAFVAARLTELRFSGKNLRRSNVDGNSSRDLNFVAIRAVHSAAVFGTLFFGGRVRWPWVVLLLAVQPVRVWIFTTLGRRWNARGIVADDLEIETGGPYRFVRHPNYAVIVVELAALPLAFGLWWLALVVGVANGLALRTRIRNEERALFANPAYRAHFARRARIIPGVF